MPYYLPDDLPDPSTQPPFHLQDDADDQRELLALAAMGAIGALVIAGRWLGRYYSRTGRLDRQRKRAAAIFLGQLEALPSVPEALSPAETARRLRQPGRY